MYTHAPPVAAATCADVAFAAATHDVVAYNGEAAVTAAAAVGMVPAGSPPGLRTSFKGYDVTTWMAVGEGTPEGGGG